MELCEGVTALQEAGIFPRLDQYQEGGPLEKLHQRPFICHVDDCQSSYHGKDHLTRHLLLHQGKLFQCPVDGCKSTFSFQGNMTRHVKEMHGQSASPVVELPKEYVCSEGGCGKVFKYASKLRKHEDSHVKLETVEALCLDPGCMKHFTNEKYLKEHIKSCHQRTVCEICGTKQLTKNIKRHLRTHEGPILERIKCEFQDCAHTFSIRSNLAQHIKAIHMGAKRFSCSIFGCGMKFASKHVRDKHEKSGCHVYTCGDFEEADEQFLSRPRGGRKREPTLIESIILKRITPPSGTDPLFNRTSESLSWLRST